jgi:hypothetical protein
VPGAAGQSSSSKQGALWQFSPRLSQVVTLHRPACGAQSALAAQAMRSTLQVALRHWASELQDLIDWVQVPLAAPPRQLTPSSQSTPTSVLSSNDPPGTPVSEPEVSSTTSMFGL